MILIEIVVCVWVEKDIMMGYEILRKSSLAEMESCESYRIAGEAFT